MVFRLSVQISRSFARSTRRLCERRKSVPMIGWVTSAMMKRHEYFWRPRLSIIWRVPNVLIGEPLAAMRERLQVFRVSDRLGGMTLNSEPVSTRKYLPDLSSYTRSREEFESVDRLFTVDRVVRFLKRFETCRVAHISWPDRPTWNGTCTFPRVFSSVSKVSLGTSKGVFERVQWCLSAYLGCA